MHLTIDHASQFRDQFHACNRGDQFSYEALNMLYEYVEDVNPDYELDVIALCCEYTEATPEEIASNFSIDLSECGGDYYEISATVRQFLENHTQLIGETSAGFVYANF